MILNFIIFVIEVDFEMKNIDFHVIPYVVMMSNSKSTLPKLLIIKPLWQLFNKIMNTNYVIILFYQRFIVWNCRPEYRFPLQTGIWWIIKFMASVPATNTLTHWGRVTHICFSKLTIIGSGNGLSPGRRQAIIWTNSGILVIRTLGTNFSEILGEIHSFSFSKMHLKLSSAKWRLFGLGLNELKGNI